MTSETSHASISLRGSVWMTVGDANFGGVGRVDLLAAIGDCGSITKAAKTIGISYKAAWEAVDTMNNLAGEALVERVVGGRGGGGTRLTARGSTLVRNFRIIEREHRRLVEALDREAEGMADDLILLRRMAMKTSARNQFQGRVVGLTSGLVNDEVLVEITGGHRLAAVLTRSSRDNLKLEEGTDVFALIKASSVVLVADDDGARFSARNQFSGQISRIMAGSVNSEVVIELAGGASLVAIVTKASATTLGLKEGAPVTALFKASSVILGVPA